MLEFLKAGATGAAKIAACFAVCTLVVAGPLVAIELYDGWVDIVGGIYYTILILTGSIWVGALFEHANREEEVG